MSLLSVLLAAGGTVSFLWLVGCEYARRRQILERRSFIQRRRMTKLADLSHRRRKVSRLATGAEGPDARAAAEMLAAMMGGHVVDRTATPAAAGAAPEPAQPV